MLRKKRCFQKFFIPLIFVLALSGLSLNPQKQETWQVISLDLKQVSLPQLASWGLDFLMEKEGRLYVVSSPQDRIRLAGANLAYHPEPAFSGRPVAVPSSAASGINGDYHSADELKTDLRSLEAGHPGLAKVYDIGRSLEGRALYALKVSGNVGAAEPEAQVLFLGCHHAREWISVEVPFLLGKYLLDNYLTDSRVRDIVDHSEVWIVPLLNPDGLEYSIHVYRYWRKNRRDNGIGSFGVDLNRNYDYQWGYDNLGSSPEPDSAVYRGRSPFSEPEAAAVRDLFRGNNFQALISYHSFSQTIYYPWGYSRKPVENAERMKALAAGISQRIQEVAGKVYRYGQSSLVSYLTNGETTDWAFGLYGIPAYTIELEPGSEQAGGFFNAETEILPIFNDNLPAALYLIEDCISRYRPPGWGEGPSGKERPSAAGDPGIRHTEKRGG
ncbi:MAG: M14 family metallopeptidase [Candidatus Aminicenantales bacterium]